MLVEQPSDASRESLPSDQNEPEAREKSRPEPPAPVPAPVTDAGETVADSRSDEERALADALAAVLARKPRRGPAVPPTPPGSDGDTPVEDDIVLATAGRRTFASALRHRASSTADLVDDAEPSSEAPGGGTLRLSSAAAWLADARRRRLLAVGRRAGAWTVTFAIGAAIVAAAAILLLDGRRSIEAWLGLATLTL